MNKKKLTLKILFFLIITDCLETLVQLCFKKSVLSETNLNITSLASSLTFLKLALLSPYLWLALITVFLIFIIWSTILSKIDLSMAVPLASFSYVLVPIVSIIFLHEKIPTLRWIGIGFIIAGIIFVSRSSKENEASL